MIYSMFPPTYNISCNYCCVTFVPLFINLRHPLDFTSHTCRREILFCGSPGVLYGAIEPMTTAKIGSETICFGWHNTRRAFMPTPVIVSRARRRFTLCAKLFERSRRKGSDSRHDKVCYMCCHDDTACTLVALDTPGPVYFGTALLACICSTHHTLKNHEYRMRAFLCL